MAKFELASYDRKFLPDDICGRFRSLDGRCVAAWLRSIGEKVTGNRDTGRNGLAVTETGYAVSTNGYVCRAANL